MQSITLIFFYFIIKLYFLIL